MKDDSPYDDCSAGHCSSQKEKLEEKRLDLLESAALAQSLSLIKHKVLVLSGKGGVGKSTIAANLSVALSLSGKRVGLLDIDIHGPSIPKIMGLEGTRITSGSNGLRPLEFNENLKVISLGFLLPNKDDAVIWRGAMKHTLIRQFLTEVEWGELDYLIVDSPPGTGDEPLSVVQLIGDSDGAIIVTTPQKVALDDVRKSLNFCRQMSLPVIGVVENMSGFVCPDCGKVANIFKRGGGEEMAAEMGVPFLGRIPLDQQIVEASDAGTPFVDNFAQSTAAKALGNIVAPILELDEQ
jgi:ATP-binding protein involved in chromosome partitioning